MRRTVQVAVYGTVAAIGFSALTLPTSAAEKDKNKDKERAASFQSTGPIGSVERANKLIGRDVFSTAENKKVGEVKDFVLDFESGRILYAVVSVGGFLGVGDRHVAVPSGALTDNEGKRLHINANKQQLMDAPQYSNDKDKEAEMVSMTFVNSAYQHYGQTAWFDAKGGTGKFGNIQRASKTIGMAVKTVADEKIGDVDNLILDLPAARLVYVILAPERSLDLKNNLFALPPMALTMGTDKDYFTTNIDRTKLAAAPHFDKSNWPNLSDRSWGSQVYQYYGKRAYFESGGLRPTSERESQKLYPEKKDKRD